MANNEGQTHYRWIGLIASVFGILEGLTWTVLGLIFLLYHHDVIPSPLEDGFEEANYNTLLMNFIYFTYLNQDGNSTADIIVAASEFYIVSWIYFLLSMVWLGLSSWQFWVLFHQKWKHITNTFFSWSTITGIFCILDVIVFGLLAHDYDFLLQEQIFVDSVGSLLTTFSVLACGTVMTLMIRVYVVWIINVALAIILTIFACELMKNGQPKGNDGPINAYAPSRYQQPLWATNESSTRIDPWLEDSRASSQTNHGFEVTNEASNPIRDESFLYKNNKVNSYRKERAQSPEQPINRNRLATVGSKNKTGQFPRSYSTPIIPDPDYTPPVSPTAFRKPVLKSVLKSRSQYT